MRHSHVYILFRLNVEVHQNSKHECFQTRRWYEPFIGHTHPAYENVEIKIRCRYVESSYSGIHTLSRAFAFGRRFCILQDCANIFVSNFCRLFLFSLSQRTVLKSNMQQSSFFFNCPCKAVIADFHHRFTLLLARKNVIQYNNSQYWWAGMFTIWTNYWSTILYTKLWNSGIF